MYKRQDLKDDGSVWYVVTPPEALEKVKDALVKSGITPTSAEVGMVPQNYVKLTGAQATQMVLSLIHISSISPHG